MTYNEFTLCGARPNDADCGNCLKMRDCREACAAICRGCVWEGRCTEPDKRQEEEEDNRQQGTTAGGW